jgi:hypothetical protein
MVERLTPNGQVSPVDVVYMFNKDVDATTTNGESVTFTFEGTSSGATNIALSSLQSQWNVSIATQTGFISYTQVTTGEGRPTPIR